MQNMTVAQFKQIAGDKVEDYCLDSALKGCETLQDVWEKLTRSTMDWDKVDTIFYIMAILEEQKPSGTPVLYLPIALRCVARVVEYNHDERASWLYERAKEYIIDPSCMKASVDELRKALHNFFVDRYTKEGGIRAKYKQKGYGYGADSAAEAMGELAFAVVEAEDHLYPRAMRHIHYACHDACAAAAKERGCVLAKSVDYVSVYGAEDAWQFSLLEHMGSPFTKPTAIDVLMAVRGDKEITTAELESICARINPNWHAAVAGDAETRKACEQFLTDYMKSVI